MKSLSKETRIYLAMWRKAIKSPDTPVQIELPNASVALTVRMAMYRAIRPFRNGSIHDPDLFTAAERLVLQVKKLDSGRATLAIVPRSTLAAAEIAMLSLGLDDDDLKLFEEKLAEEELSDLLTPATPPSNPFFTRG